MSGVDRLTERAERELNALERAQLRRQERVWGDPARDFCSNDYLGLARDPEVVAQVRATIDAVGAGASRLVSGTLPAHHALERALAAWLRAPAARLFTSGYQANMATLGALLQPGDTVVSDARNHASLIDAMRLTKARRIVTPHADIDAVRAAIASHEGEGLCFVVTESLFSMDGQLAPLEALASVCDETGAILVVDEAHATGVMGPEGAGACVALGLEDAVPLRLGTGGKALGVHGAFAAGPAPVIDLLQSRGRAYVFTTAVSPMVVAALGVTLPLVREERRRAALMERRERFAELLAARGWWGAEPPPGPIFPLVVGEAAAALEASRALEAAGFFVRAIRPPTVPPGTSRLRVTVRADHAWSDLEGLVDALPPKSAFGLP